MPGPIHAGNLLNRSGWSPDPTDDHQLWQTLKPYIGHCLTLNHEVNNPLTALLGYIEILLAEPDKLSSSQVECLEHIRVAAAKIQAAAQGLSQEKIELAEKIDLRPVVEAFTRLARDHNK